MFLTNFEPLLRGDFRRSFCKTIRSIRNLRQSRLHPRSAAATLPTRSGGVFVPCDLTASATQILIDFTL